MVFSAIGSEKYKVILERTSELNTAPDTSITESKKGVADAAS